MQKTDLSFIIIYNIIEMFKNTFAMVALAGVVAAESMQPACIMEQGDAVGSRSREPAYYDFYDRADFSPADVPSHYRIR